MLCSQRIAGRGFFRVVFFLPLMVTPVGIAYMFRMLADMTQGPLAPLWRLFGLGDLANEFDFGQAPAREVASFEKAQISPASR